MITGDLKYALRTLLKAPGFSLIVIVTLALSIGSSTAIFSFVDAILLRSMPYPEPERVVDVRELDERGRSMAVSEANFEDLRHRSRSFESLARYAAGPEAVVGGTEPVQANVCLASAEFFRVLGIQPFLGRFISPNSLLETKEVAVVSFAFWKRCLNARVDLKGTALRLENRVFTVIGVLPAEAEFPPRAEVWIPAEIYPAVASRTAHNWSVAGRLRQGVSFAQARAELNALGRQMLSENGKATDAAGFGVTALRERSIRDLRSILWIVGAAGVLLLMVACSNVANLLLVRATARRQEIAVRMALGASQFDLVRRSVLETLLLALLASGLGALLAFWSVDLILALYHGSVPQVGRIGVNLSVLVFTLLLALLVGLLLGLLPAITVEHRSLQDDLRSAGRGKSASDSSVRSRNALVVAQIALTLLLLVGAGLLGRSFLRVLTVDPGFRAENTVSMTLHTQFSEDPSAVRQPAQFYHQLLERLRALPGVDSVGAVSFPPMAGFKPNGTFIMEDGSRPATTMEALSEQLTALAGTGKTGNADYRTASAGYFKTLGIPLLQGRLFAESDGPDSPHAALVSATFVKRFWPDQNPIGRQLQFGNMDGDLHLLHVVGVVGDVRDQSLEADARPIIYTNYFQRRLSPAGFCIVLRGNADTGALVSAMRRETQRINPEVALEFQTVRDLVSTSLDRRRFSIVMLAVFAGAALLLAMVGLYGVMSYVTAQRTGEIGIRMALGGQRGDMLRLILRQSFFLVGVGLTVGLALALGATRAMRSFLFGIGTIDVLTYGAVIGLLLVAALVASFLPARRAMKVDPMVALRYE